MSFWEYHALSGFSSKLTPEKVSQTLPSYRSGLQLSYDYWAGESLREDTCSCQPTADGGVLLEFLNMQTSTTD